MKWASFHGDKGDEGNNALYEPAPARSRCRVVTLRVSRPALLPDPNPPRFNILC